MLSGLRGHTGEAVLSVNAVLNAIFSYFANGD